MSEHISAEIRRLVRKRANSVCEYCLISEENSYFRHQLEHIISLKHGGSSQSDNLALACVFCNRNKGSDIASVVPGSTELTRFFNPRIDVWSNHFRLEDSQILPLTNIGEATIRILQFNSDDRVLEREILFRGGSFPDDAALLLIREH
jgi:hypothetical protein